MDIGSVLREARSRRGLTLAQVAQATKVPPSMLDHIEHNRFDRLPGSVFTKGYLRAFAAAVGVEGESVVREYVQQAAPSPTVVNVPQPVSPEPSAQMAGRIGKTGLGLLAVALVLYFARDAPQPAANPAADITSVPTSVATSGAVAPPASDPVVSWPVQLQMTVSADCWVSARVDGKSAVYRLLRGGEQVSVTVDHDAVLRIGDPTVFTYTLNGRPGRPVGRPGMPATIRISRDTYRDFLESRPRAPDTPGVS